jgi:hypothetical protein
MNVVCIRIVIALVALVALAAPASAWNATGHYAIDLAVWRSLPAAQREKLSEILRHHPLYERDLLAEKPEGVADAEWAFVRAGSWPDIVRDQNNPMHWVGHKGNWHYTLVPFYPEGGQDLYVPTPEQPAKPGEPWDSVSAWDYNLARLNNPGVPMSQRAVALCWVLHLGGDIHQPLHNVSTFSPDFPAGDRGGNDRMFLIDGRPKNLHAIWDDLLGQSRQWTDVAAIADELAQLPPAELKGADAGNLHVREWVRGAAELAVAATLRNGEIRGAVRSKLRDNPNLPVPELPADYLAPARKVAVIQSHLAFRRTGSALSGLELAPSTVPEPATTQPATTQPATTQPATRP